MVHPYSPPQSELFEPASPPRPSWRARLFAALLGSGALLAWMSSGVGVFQFLEVDGLQLEEGLALVLLLAFRVFWLPAVLSWWRGGRRPWLWVLAPFLVLGALFVLLVVWELALGLP